MKLGLVIPPKYFSNVLKEVIKKNFPEIKATYITYNDYKDVVTLVGEQQDKFDAFLFSGRAPYSYLLEHKKQESVWDYIYQYGSSVYRAILEASLAGFNLQRISFDSCTREELKEIYKEFQQDLGQCRQITYDDIMDNEKYNSLVIDFHKRNFAAHLCDCCITSLYTVHEALKKELIPTFFIAPTHEACKEAIRRIATTYRTSISQESQIVVISIETHLPNEYSSLVQNEYEYNRDKFIVFPKFYAFAESLQAATVEATYRNFLIFTTRNMLEAVTNNLYDFRLLDESDGQHLNAISIGIGYGKSVREAYRNANEALIKAKKDRCSAAYIIYSDHSLRGPLLSHKKNEVLQKNKLEYFQKISDKTGIKSENIKKLYEIINALKKDEFTSNELANYLSFSKRTTDRFVHELMEYGYAEVLEHCAKKTMGRPSRIIKIMI